MCEISYWWDKKKHLCIKYQRPTCVVGKQRLEKQKKWNPNIPRYMSLMLLKVLQQFAPPPHHYPIIPPVLTFKHNGDTLTNFIFSYLCKNNVIKKSDISILKKNNIILITTVIWQYCQIKSPTSYTPVLKKHSYKHHEHAVQPLIDDLT